jgi:hypothetical protein
VGGVRINAVIDTERKLRLFHALLDEGISFTEWLRRQIDSYLAEREKPARRRKGKEG